MSHDSSAKKVPTLKATRGWTLQIISILKLKRSLGKWSWWKSKATFNMREVELSNWDLFTWMHPQTMLPRHTCCDVWVSTHVQLHTCCTDPVWFSQFHTSDRCMESKQGQTVSCINALAICIGRVDLSALVVFSSINYAAQLLQLHTRWASPAATCTG